MIKLQMLGDEIVNQPKEEVTIVQMKGFPDLLIDITNQNRATSIQVEDAIKRVLAEFEFKGIDFNEYILKLNL